jgi:hypothetical protein
MSKNSYYVLKRMDTARGVLAIICEKEALTSDTITSEIRFASVVEARHLFCYLMRKHTSYTTPEIGSFINRDHTSVLYACKSISNRIDTDKSFRIKVDLYNLLVGEFLNYTDRNFENYKTTNALLRKNTRAICVEISQLIHKDAIMEGWRKNKIQDLLMRQLDGLTALGS